MAIPANAAGQGNAEIEITSVPNGSDVELDGSFIGNTPSTVGVSQGDHSVSVKKNGYKPWERKIKITTGNIEDNCRIRDRTGLSLPFLTPFEAEAYDSSPPFVTRA